MENQLFIHTFDGELRIRPNGDKIVILPFEKFDNILKRLEVAGKLAHRVRVRMNIRGKDNERLMYEIERAAEEYENLR